MKGAIYALVFVSVWTLASPGGLSSVGARKIPEPYALSHPLLRLLTVENPGTAGGFSRWRLSRLSEAGYWALGWLWSGLQEHPPAAAV